MKSRLPFATENATKGQRHLLASANIRLSPFVRKSLNLFFPKGEVCRTKARPSLSGAKSTRPIRRASVSQRDHAVRE